VPRSPASDTWHFVGYITKTAKAADSSGSLAIALIVEAGLRFERSLVFKKNVAALPMQEMNL
jgi:hypothetical protein